MKRLTDFYHSLPIVRDNKGNRSTSHAYFNFEGKQYTIAIDSSSVQPLIALKAHLSEENFYRILCDNDLLIDNNPYGIEYYGYEPVFKAEKKDYRSGDVHYILIQDLVFIVTFGKEMLHIESVYRLADDEMPAPEDNRKIWLKTIAFLIIMCMVYLFLHYLTAHFW